MKRAKLLFAIPLAAIFAARFASTPTIKVTAMMKMMEMMKSRSIKVLGLIKYQIPKNIETSKTPINIVRAMKAMGFQLIFEKYPSKNMMRNKPVVIPKASIKV